MKRRYFTPILGIMWWVEEGQEIRLRDFIPKYLLILSGSVLAPTAAIAFLIKLIDLL